MLRELRISSGVGGLTERLMDNYVEVIGRIARQTGTSFGPASLSSLSELRALEFPEAAIEFYEQYEPSRCAEGQVRLWPIDDIVVENRQGVPGICVQPYGYGVFATTLSGDAYCFNSNKLDADGGPEIVLVSHEVLGEDSTLDEVKRVVKPVAACLLDFLEQFSRGELDEECIYGTVGRTYLKTKDIKRRADKNVCPTIAWG